MKGGGDLDALLARHLEGDGSGLARTLAQHVGEQSPLYRLLSPSQADGLVATLAKAIDEALAAHRAHVANQFSLDSSDSALSRLVKEVTAANGELRTEFKSNVDTVIGQFSLDDPQSALSRLVQQVQRASQSITDQFSLDRGGLQARRVDDMMTDAAPGR